MNQNKMKNKNKLLMSSFFWGGGGVWGQYTRLAEQPFQKKNLVCCGPKANGGARQPNLVAEMLSKREKETGI